MKEPKRKKVQGKVAMCAFPTIDDKPNMWHQAHL